jgi:predicted O-methyltransferase YrrM
MQYLDFLSRVHALHQPANYLEIGVRFGHSLALAQCRAVGIDPAYLIEAELSGEVHLKRTTSDEYFTRPDCLDVTDGQPFDFAFIDGMHLFEFGLRDFINTEEHANPWSVVIFDDVLPRNVPEAARQRHTGAWTGDVFPIIEVLRRYRPELVTILVDTAPTGLMFVLGLDPSNTTLRDNYDEIVRDFRRPDPQVVPQQLLDRGGVQTPARVLEAGFWQTLREQRDQPGLPDFHLRLREQLAADLGTAYGPVSQVS